MALEELGSRPAGVASEPHSPAAEAELLFENSARLSTSRSIAWSLGGQVGTTTLSMLSTVVLARILTPNDFGAFAFATTIYTLVQFLLQSGLGNYILSEARLTRRKLDAAFLVASGQGLVAFLIVAAAAPVAGWLSKSPTVGWVTLAVAVTPFLSSAESVSDALWLRGGRYRAVAALQIAKLAMQATTSIVAEVIWHWGPFALVAGLLANAATSFAVALFTLVVTHRARPAIDAEHWRRLRSFGGKSLLLTIAQIGSLSIPNLLLGRMLGIFILGHYNRATNAVDMVSRTFASSVVRATAPRFYNRVNAGEPLPPAVREMCDMLLFFVWPATAGIAVLSAPLIRLMYGPQWGIAARAMPLLCLAFAFDSARTGGNEVLLIRDRLGLSARLEFLRAGYAILLVVVLARFGLIAALWGRVTEAAVTALLYLLAMRRVGGVPLRGWAPLFAVNALLTGAACGPAILLMRHWGWPVALDPARFLTAIGLGLVLWLGVLALIRHPFMIAGVAFARRRLTRPARRGALR